MTTQIQLFFSPCVCARNISKSCKFVRKHFHLQLVQVLSFHFISLCTCEYSSTGWMKRTFCCATHYQTYKWLLHITHLRFLFFRFFFLLPLCDSRLPLPLSLHTFMRVKFISSSWIHFLPVTSGTSTTIHLANVLCPWTEPMSLYLALCTKTHSAVLFLSLPLPVPVLHSDSFFPLTMLFHWFTWITHE